jgi:UDP-glucose 4-epimerase
MEKLPMSSSLQGSRVLVTGGAGFVGSHLVDRLIALDAARVVVVDNLVRGRLDNLDAARASGRVEFVMGDITDGTLVDSAMTGIDIVFHQAALRITHCAAEPVLAVNVMVNGLQNVLESAVRHGVRKVVAASSASVYGEPDSLPMDERHPFNNRTLYGALKIANEQMLRSYSEMHGLKYVVLRPFNIYGPRMDVFGVYTEVMIRWLERLSAGQAPIILGDGKQTMDFVFVKDVAEAYVLAAASEADDIALNLGSGIEVSLAQLCRLLCEQAGFPNVEPEFQPPRKVNPVTRRRAATARTFEAIGFKATTSLREGLDALISWHADVRTLEKGRVA